MTQLRRLRSVNFWKMSEPLNFQCRKKSAFKRIFIIRSGTFNFYEKTFKIVLGIFKKPLNCVDSAFKIKRGFKCSWIISDFLCSIGDSNIATKLNGDSNRLLSPWLNLKGSLLQVFRLLLPYTKHYRFLWIRYLRRFGI